MKKKTKKKTAKKQAKKKMTFRRYNSKPKGLWPKIHAVSEKIKEIPSTGKELDNEGNEYSYTRAKEVFRIYGDAMNEVGLTFMPVNIDTVLDPRFYRVTVTYRITDIDTGDFTDVVGAGLGANGIWSLNSGQTVARKQCLLNAFGASYGENETTKDIVRKQMQGFDINKLIGINLDPKKAADDIKQQAVDTFR